MRRTLFERIVTYVLAVAILLLAIGPFVWVILTSLKSDEQIYKVSELIPTYVTTKNYIRVLYESYFVRYFINSIYISIIVTIISVIVATMAAYGFSRYHLFGSGTLKLGILFTKMFPGVLLAIPYYVLMKNLGLIDSHKSLIIIDCSFALPFAVWNLCSFFSQIPWDIEESALVDGCNRFQSFVKVIFPIARPGMAATAMYCFLMGWDEYMYANTFINTTAKKTIQVGIRDFIGEYSTEWGPMMAAVVMGLVPIIILFLMVQKNLVGGLAAGAVKG